MVRNSISIERFKEKDLDEKKAPQNEMESSASLPKSSLQSRLTDVNSFSVVTSVPKTKMASPSTPQFPTAPVSNHVGVSETALSPKNLTNSQVCPSVNSLCSQSTSMGTNCMQDTGSGDEEKANARTRDTLPCNLINTSAVMLPSMPPNGKKSPTPILPDKPKESFNPLPLALLDRNSLTLPLVSANNSETTTSRNYSITPASKETTMAEIANKSTSLTPQSDFQAKSTMGLVLTCHDRLETVLMPKNIIEYKSMDTFASPSLANNNNVCRNIDGLSKQATGPTSVPKGNMVSSDPLLPKGSRASSASTLQKNVENSSAKQPIKSLNDISTQPCHFSIHTVTKSPSRPNSDDISTASTISYASGNSKDWINRSELPLMTQTNMETKKSIDPTSNVAAEGAPMNKNDLISKGRPDHLDLPQTNMETSKHKSESLSKSSSKSPGEKLLTRNSSGALSMSQTRIKSDPLTTKRSIDSPSKPKIISKSPSREKMDKKLFRYSISMLPGSPQVKLEDGVTVPKATAVLPSKPKTITKSPSVDKMDKRLNKSTTEVLSVSQSKMAIKATVPKTDMASPTKARTISKSPSTKCTSKNYSELPQMPQTKMADAGSSPQPPVTSPTKPKALSKSPSVDKIASKKSLRKEKSCPTESSPVTERRPSLKPPWRGGAWTPSRSQTSLSLAQSGFIRRSESSMSVNAGLRSRAGLIRPATSLPHIPKTSSSRPCLLVALRPTNLQQERERFFESQFMYEPQFEYEEAELSTVLDKYREGSDLFLQQAVGIMECVLRKYGSYENFEEVTGGNVLPKSQVWAAVRKYLQKEGCVGEVVVRLSDELLSQAVMVVENCRPTLTINLAGARQHWLEGMLRHEIGTHYLRGVNNTQQPWASSEHRKALGLKGANPTEEGLASLHSVLLRRQPHLWRAALLYYTVHHAASMSFSQLFHHIQRFVHSPDVRWEYCLRAKRGQTDTSRPGCFSKDQVYLDGILRILRHRRTIDFQLLTSLGKVSFEDVERLRPLAVLSRTRIPHFMTDTDRYLSQLDHILSTNELSDAELQHLLP